MGAANWPHIFKTVGLCSAQAYNIPYLFPGKRCGAEGSLVPNNPSMYEVGGASCDAHSFVPTVVGTHGFGCILFVDDA